MINIKLSKRYALTSDSRQFILNKIKIANETKRDKKTNEIIYKKGDELLFPFAFFPSLEAAIKGIPDKIILNSNIKTIDGLITQYKKTIDKLLCINIENENNKEEKIIKKLNRKDIRK